MIPARYTLGGHHRGEKRKKWGEVFSETECHFAESTGTIRPCAVYCALCIHYRNPSNIL